ncbi:hypothetical protein J9303_19590 [Bacillaceae bacterium Marseille-Q3522]|nr:hypothetical protein [Bacillaceae bacterium Marseille-Q3522]
MLLLVFLTACSFLDDAQNTLDYVNETTDYINTATAFAEEVPGLAEQAVTDQQAAEDLEARLTEMEESITAFSELQAPGVVEDLHQQLLDHNETIQSGIDLYQENIKDGKLDPAVLENTEIGQSIHDIQDIFNQIQEIGQ